MNKLSVIIITKNEAHNIRRCLESVRWADEIVLLDSGSTDGTQDIAREYGAIVHDTDWPGFGAQKNRALELATGEWVLSLDADEWLSDQLQQNVRHAIAQAARCAYKILRRTYFCGKLIRFGDWRNDRPLRLFPRVQASFSEDIIHERVVTQLPVKNLEGIMLHDSYQTLEQVVATMNRYSSLGAEQSLQRNKSAGILGALWRGFWRFFRGYFLRLGFLDGAAGFMLAIYNGECSFYRYAKLRFLNRKVFK